MPDKENGPAVLWLSCIGTGATLLFWLIWLWVRKLEVPVPKVADATVGFPLVSSLVLKLVWLALPSGMAYEMPHSGAMFVAFAMFLAIGVVSVGYLFWGLIQRVEQ